MNKLGINLWNWAPGLSDACCGLPTKAAEMGFTALELPMTQPTVSPTLRDEVRGSGLEVSLCAAMGAGRDLSSFDADVRAATMQYLTDCLQTGAALGAVVLAGPLYAGGGKRHTLPPAEAAREWELAVTGLQELTRRAASPPCKRARRRTEWGDAGRWCVFLHLPGIFLHFRKGG